MNGGEGRERGVGGGGRLPLACGNEKKTDTKERDVTTFSPPFPPNNGSPFSPIPVFASHSHLLPPSFTPPPPSLIPPSSLPHPPLIPPPLLSFPSSSVSPFRSVICIAASGRLFERFHNELKWVYVKHDNPSNGPVVSITAYRAQGTIFVSDWQVNTPI